MKIPIEQKIVHFSTLKRLSKGHTTHFIYHPPKYVFSFLYLLFYYISTFISCTTVFFIWSEIRWVVRAIYLFCAFNRFETYNDKCLFEYILSKYKYRGKSQQTEWLDRNGMAVEHTTVTLLNSFSSMDTQSDHPLRFTFQIPIDHGTFQLCAPLSGVQSKLYTLKANSIVASFIFLV